MTLILTLINNTKIKNNINHENNKITLTIKITLILTLTNDTNMKTKLIIKITK